MPRILRPIAASIVDLFFLLTMPSHRGLSVRHKNSLPLRVFAFGEFVPVRCVITNKFALHSLTRNFALFKKRESLHKKRAD